MSAELSGIIQEAQAAMDKAVAHLAQELLRVRTGKANPALLEGVFVEAYGSNMPLNAVANITTPDARTLIIQPWDKSTLRAIETAIINSNLGLNPGNDGDIIRISLPPLTEERRKDLVKMAKQMAEEAKVSIRNARRDANERIKKMVKDGLAEDLAKDGESKVQNVTDKSISKVDETLAAKEKEIMTV
jgi:ribosome recycling factor